MSYTVDATCPRCGSRRIVLGELTRGRTIGPAEPFSFRAFAARLSSLRVGARVKPTMAACAHCGLLWSQLSVESLMTHLERFPSDEVRQWLRHAHDTPL